MTKLRAALMGATTAIVLLAGHAWAGPAIPPVTVEMFDFTFVPRWKIVQLNDSVSWRNEGATAHGVQTTATMPRSFTIASLQPGETSTGADDFNAAGMWTYRCTFHPRAMRGSIAVPLLIDPPTQPLGLPFTLSVADSPGNGLVNYDIQVKKPGSDRYVALFPNTPANNGIYTPPKRGTYRLRSRVQDNADPDLRTGFSPPVKIKVT